MNVGLPGSATPDARRLLLTRGLRGLVDGLVSVLLARYLALLGLSIFEISAIVTGTLLGSAALTLAVGLVGHRVDVRSRLLAASALMVATGLGFAAFKTFWPLLVVAVVGTLNPSAGDVSVFLPSEQALVSESVAISQMDVPARQSYVMAIVPPEERPAAASVTNVPRSLAASLAPLVAGYLLDRTAFGWPLVLAGGLKIAYDLLLLAQFHAVHPPEETRG